MPVVLATDPDGKVIAEQTGRLAVQVAASLEAQTLSSDGLKAIVPSAVSDWLGADQVRAVQFAYTYEKPAVTLRLSARPQPTKVRLELFNGVTIRTTAAWYTCRLRYTIDGSPIDRVSFTMPTQYAALVAVNSPSMRSVSSEKTSGDLTKWTVTLANEVTGVLDVTVNFALPIDASTTELPLPRIVSDAPSHKDGGYRAIVAVQNFSRHELGVKDSTVLAPLPPGEQKTLLAGAAQTSLQYVWQAFSDDWSLNLKLTPAKAAARTAAIVDLMAVTTVIDRQGQCRYEVRIELQNRSEQFLRVVLPEGIKLWSAIVADEPVKPVLPAAGGKSGEVLIPLVKTSAGGLPYDVKLYLAGQGVGALDGITKVQPPAITLAGIDVQRTTWSLRLPAGYKYELRWAGGNMSPIAGAVEKMAIFNDVAIGQLQRLAESGGDYSSDGGSNATITRNFNTLNSNASGMLAETDRYLESNKREIPREQYEQQRQKLEGQKKAVADINAHVNQRQQDQQAQFTGNINGYLNSNSPNSGVIEFSRNQAINEVPRFFSSANQKNLDAVNSELDALNKMAEMPAKKPTALPQPNPADTSVKSAEDLLGDKENTVVMLTDGRADANKDAVKGKIEELKKQQDQLSDNRLGRLYNQGQSQAQAAKDQSPGKPNRQPGEAGRVSGIGRDDLGVSSAAVATGGRNLPATRPVVASPGVGPNGPTDGPAPTTPENHAPPPVAYVSGGTFSLPVQLPEGEVQLDFSHPSGQATVALWAIPTGLVTAVNGTITLLVVLVCLWIGRGIWRRAAKKKGLATSD